jgi:hypothetical protein
MEAITAEVEELYCKADYIFEHARFGFEPMHKGFADQLETHGWSAFQLQLI